jgi:RNA polymerase sigma-70 factor (ECF subfamily)
MSRGAIVALDPRLVVGRLPRPAWSFRVPDMDDVVARCQAGDRAAFRELFVQHRADVVRLVHRLMDPRHGDVDDLVQEVFFQVHRSIRSFRGRSRFSTWLYRLAVNVVLMHRRAARSRPQLISAVNDESVSDPAPAPDEIVARRARVEAFERLIDQLSEKKRTVYILHELEGLSPADVSQIVGAPILTVRTRLFYARRELERRIAEDAELAGLVGGPASDDTSQRGQP